MGAIIEPKPAEEYDRVLSSIEERQSPIFLRRNADIAVGGCADPSEITE